MKSTPTPIGELVDVVKNWNPTSRPEDEFLYIDLSAVSQREKRVVSPARVLGAEAPSRARQLVRQGDILVSTVRPNLNGVAAVTEEFDGATASTGFCVLRPRTAKLTTEYLMHWVQSPKFVDTMVREATGASYPAVSDRIVKSSLIPLPPLDEQRRIAAILDTADALRRKRKCALGLLDGLAQSIFRDMFGDYKRSMSVPKVFVREVGRVQLGRQRAPKYQTGKFTKPYVRVANVYEDVIDTSDILSMDFNHVEFPEYRLEYGDILLNEGQSTELVGRPAMWRCEIDECCFQNTLIRFQANRNRIMPEFALAVFLDYFRSGEFSKISSKTSSVAHLGAARFAAMPFPLLPLERQREFAQRKNAVDRRRGQVSESAILSEALFSTLQHRAFTGQL